MLRSVRLPSVLGALALAAVLPASTAAQDASLAVEILGGATIPVASFATGTGVGEGTASGASFGVLVTAAGRGRITKYLGFSQHRFGCADAGCRSDGLYVVTGLNAGLRFSPLDRGMVLPWIGIGGLTARVESPGVTGSPAGVSSLGYGAEAGAGLYIGGGRAVALNPQVRFATVGVDLPGAQRLTVRSVVASLALVLAF